MIRSGTFGWADFFQPLCDSIDGPSATDFYLLANDFPSYLEAQVYPLRFCLVLPACLP